MKKYKVNTKDIKILLSLSLYIMSSKEILKIDCNKAVAKVYSLKD